MSYTELGEAQGGAAGAVQGAESRESPLVPSWGCLGVHSYLWCCSSHALGTAHSPSVLQGLVGNLLRGGFGTYQSRGEICLCVTFVTNILAPEEADLVKGESTAADRESSWHP